MEVYLINWLPRARQTNLLDYVGVVEVLHFTQQRHLADHERRDPVLRRVPADVEFLDRQEALLAAQLPGFVHLAVGAFSHLHQQLVAQRLRAELHGVQDSGLISQAFLDKSKYVGSFIILFFKMFFKTLVQVEE